MVNTVSYNKVLARLRQFIRKYYLNKSLRGLLLSVIVFAVFAGILVLGNQGLKLNVGWRTVGIWFLSISMALMILMLVVVPFFQYLGVGRRLNYKKAERILSSHFSEMKDTLLNMLELAEEHDEDVDNSLLLASIEDKAGRIKWYRFGGAVPMKRLLRYIPFFLGIILLGGFLYIGWPDFVKQGYARTVNFKTDYDLPAVYDYKILNDSLMITLGDDLEIRVQALFDRGEEEVYLRVGQNREIMKDEGDGVITHTLKAVNAPTVFRLQYKGILSKTFEIGVIPSPELIQFTLQSFPPPYTQIESIILNNEGDLDIPLGTNVLWNVNAMFTDRVIISFPDDTVVTDRKDAIFSGRKRIMESGKYKIELTNTDTEKHPELGFNIRVRPDLYPEIDVNELRDSLMKTQIFFQGFISDDYGFSKLEFIIETIDGTVLVNDDLMRSYKGTGMKFYHAKDMSEIGEEGEQLFYYFSIWDNDAVNGAKRTDSRKLGYRNITYSELVDQNKERAEKIVESLSEVKDIVELLTDKLDDMKMAQLMDKKEDWEIKSKVKEMEEMQDLLEELFNNIKNENLIKGAEQDNLDLDNERLIKKQLEIQELLEKIMDDELRQLLKEFEELVEEANKSKLLEKLEELDMNLEKLERQLDASLELLKRYEVEKEVFRTAHELEKMADELKGLDAEKDTSRMSDMEEEYQKLNENYEEQLKKNQELKDPMKMDSMEEDRNEISEEMKDMNKDEGDSKSKNDSKKSAGEKMKKLGEKMKSMMMGSGDEQDQIDLEILRQLTRELNDFSFKQEELMEIVDRVNANNPEYAKAAVEERELKEKYNVIRDSLVSIGQKQAAIAKLLNEEMFHVETSLENLMKSYQNERKSQVRIEQQNVMKGVNELAVRLDELVQSQSQSQSGSGGGKSPFKDSNPKSGKDKIGEMKGQQQSLKEQLEGMINKMKQGKQGKPDNKGLAQMLAEREMMRQAMEKLRNSGELGEAAKGKLNEVQELMEEIEMDIIYNRLGDRTLRREKMIESKMLEAEQAEMEREQENKREATEFRGTIKQPDNKVWEEFQQEKKHTLELMKYRDIKLKEFYRKKYFDYLEFLEKQKK